jgi:hypothetical protein
MYAEMFSKNLKERGHSEDLAVDEDNIKINLEKWGMRVRI